MRIFARRKYDSIERNSFREFRTKTLEQRTHPSDDKSASFSNEQIALSEKNDFQKKKNFKKYELVKLITRSLQHRNKQIKLRTKNSGRIIM